MPSDDDDALFADLDLHLLDATVLRTPTWPLATAPPRCPGDPPAPPSIPRRAATLRQGTLQAFIRPAPLTTALPRAAVSADPATLPHTMPRHPPAYFSRAPSPHVPDTATLASFLYPIDRPVRAYQYHIVRQALFSNTLVALPTGLGKTFLAAVVIANYFRWFPRSKIVFILPTRPLIGQQRREVCRAVGVPPETCCELSGKQAPLHRTALWQDPAVRIYFLTCEVLRNDLESGICPAQSIVCLVVDEAHHATGNHAARQAVQLLRHHAAGNHFRLLALSATPGQDTRVVQDLVDALGLTRLEMRTERSADVCAYTYAKEPDLVHVPDDPRIVELRARVVAWLQPMLARLRKLGAISDAQATQAEIMLGTRYQVVAAREAYRNIHRGAPRNHFSKAAEGDFGLLVSLAHGIDLLRNYGVKAFYDNIKDTVSEAEGGGGSATKRRMFADALWRDIWRDVTQWVQDPRLHGHPKMFMMETLILDHFTRFAEQQHNQADSRGTRVIVFAEYRDVVTDLVRVLDRHRPLILPAAFVGQSSRGKKQPAGGGQQRVGSTGMAQKKQLEVLRKFRAGQGINTLVATCIGEEGLDVGGVDLCICFDSKSSATRMQQRQGRTGRHRPGRVVVLYTHDRELSKHRQSESKYRAVQKSVERGDIILPDGQNPRILPVGADPSCDFRLMAGDVASDNDDNNDDEVDGELGCRASKRRRIDQGSATGGPFLTADELLELRRDFGGSDIDPSIRWSLDADSWIMNLQGRVDEVGSIGHGRHSLGAVDLMRSINAAIIDGDVQPARFADSTALPQNESMDDEDDERIMLGMSDERIMLGISDELLSERLPEYRPPDQDLGGVDLPSFPETFISGLEVVHDLTVSPRIEFSEQHLTDPSPQLPDMDMAPGLNTSDDTFQVDLLDEDFGEFSTPKPIVSATKAPSLADSTLVDNEFDFFDDIAFNISLTPIDARAETVHKFDFDCDLISKSKASVDDVKMHLFKAVGLLASLDLSKICPVGGDGANRPDAAVACPPEQSDSTVGPNSIASRSIDDPFISGSSQGDENSFVELDNASKSALSISALSASATPVRPLRRLQRGRVPEAKRSFEATVKPALRKRRKVPISKGNPFFDTEAALSGSDDDVVDLSSSQNLDSYESSFVVEDDVHDTGCRAVDSDNNPGSSPIAGSQMQAVYRRSLLSPEQTRLGFGKSRINGLGRHLRYLNSQKLRHWEDTEMMKEVDEESMVGVDDESSAEVDEHLV